MAEIVNTILPPDWVTKDFIQSKLRIGLKDEQLVIEDCDIKPAVAAGDNYGSQMFRITLKVIENGKPEKLPVIIKLLPAGREMVELINQINVFAIETRMYTETLPAMQRIMDEVCSEKYLTLYPEIYYEQGAPNYALMLEDLCADGFKLANRFEGLDLEHSVFVLEHLARFHASSFVLMKRDPSIAEQYNETIYSEKNAITFTKLVKGGLGALVEECETWSDLPKTYVDKMRDLKPFIMDKFFQGNKRNDDFKVNVILHGDSWINNMMFKYNGDKLVAMKFVDFQVANYNSLAVDVVYFIFTSCSADVRIQSFDFLIEKYYESFMKMLKILNYSIDFSFEEFQKEVMDRLMFGFIINFLFYPISCAPKGEAVNMDDMFDQSGREEYAPKNVFQNPVYKKVAKASFPFFVKHGVI